jgi:hypothetical protein
MLRGTSPAVGCRFWLPRHAFAKSLWRGASLKMPVKDSLFLILLQNTTKMVGVQPVRSMCVIPVTFTEQGALGYEASAILPPHRGKLKMQYALRTVAP